MFSVSPEFELLILNVVATVRFDANETVLCPDIANSNLGVVNESSGIVTFCATLFVNLTDAHELPFNANVGVLAAATPLTINVAPEVFNTPPVILIPFTSIVEVPALNIPPLIAKPFVAIDPLVSIL